VAKESRKTRKVERGTKFERGYTIKKRPHESLLK